MIEINLLPLDYRPKVPKFVAPQLPVKKTFILLASIFLLAQLGASVFTVFQVTRLRLLQNKVDVLEKESKQIADKKKEISAYAKRFRVFADISQRDFYWSSLLNELTGTMTKGVWLTGFGVKGGGSDASKILKLDGSVVGQGEETAFTGKYIRELKSNPVFTQLFTSIELSNLVQKKIREVDVYDFSIYCTFKPMKEKKKKEVKEPKKDAKEPKKAAKSEPKKGKAK